MYMIVEPLYTMILRTTISILMYTHMLHVQWSSIKSYHIIKFTYLASENPAPLNRHFDEIWDIDLIITMQSQTKCITHLAEIEFCNHSVTVGNVRKMVLARPPSLALIETSNGFPELQDIKTNTSTQNVLVQSRLILHIIMHLQVF